MARIAGVNLDDNWRVAYALTRIKGIGWNLSDKITTELKFDDSKRLKDLSPEELSSIATKLEEYDTEGELGRKVREDVRRLVEIGTYRGTRHRKNLPARGQRTRSNARQKRGKRRTVGAFKKDMLTKMQSTSAKTDK